GLSEDRMEEFVRRRGDGYDSVRDVWLRSGLDIEEIARLAQADAFLSLRIDRRAALWAVRALDGKSAAETLALLDRPSLRLRELVRATRPRSMPPGEPVIRASRAPGRSLKARPVSSLRPRLDRSRVIPAAFLSSRPDGRRVSGAGLVLVR